MTKKTEKILKGFLLSIIFTMIAGLLFVIISCFSPPAPEKAKQTIGRNALKSIGENMMAYINKHTGKPGAVFPPLTDTVDGLLKGEVPASDPFFTTNFVYSEQKVEDYLIKEGEPLPAEEDLHKILDVNVDIIIVEGAKEICEGKLLKYAPLKPYCLKGDMVVGDQND